MRKLLAVVLVLAVYGIGAANLLYTKSTGELQLVGDYACFKYTEGTELVHTEVYYSFLRSQLAFQPDSIGYHAMLNMFIEIKNDSGAVVDSSSWSVGNWIETIADAEVRNYLINDIINAQLMPGNYHITLKASDVNSGIAGELYMDIAVPKYSESELEISQIEMIYSVSEADGGDFDKAGRKLIPNTRSLYSRDDSIVYFYAEVYNLDKTIDEYIVNISIIDANGNTFKELPPMTQKVVAKSEVLLNGFNITAFKLGTYKLRLTVQQGDNTATTEKPFDLTPGQYDYMIAREQRELADFPEAMQITTEEEAKNFKNQILYIATRDELRQYNDLPLNGKTRFAEAFWQRRDPTPDTPINEYKIEHYQRFRFANEAYSTFRGEDAEKNGWRSDRGRVYIVYGPPDDIEHHPSSLEELPWSEWFYNSVDGGSRFIFIDQSGYDDFRLIHSTARGEIKDENWVNRIRPTSAY